MNVPVATERKSFLPLRLRSATVVGSSNIRTASRSTTPVTTAMPLTVQNDFTSSLAVGNRVLVNGLKIGTLCYIGTVKFAQGLFYGVELDEPEGKHDGQVNDIRYFQCKTNHGVFVPYDKVVPAPRERTSSAQRSISRLKPPTVRRSMTMSSSMDTKIKQIPIKIPSTHPQLPDIIPNPSISTQPMSIVKTINDPFVTIDQDMSTPTEEVKLITKPIFHSQTLTIDEPPETIEADFTDSVSLILHQLQQEQKMFLIEPRTSIAISEESINEDDDDITDEMDTESIADSSMSEKIQTIHSLFSTTDTTKSVQTDLSFDINDNMLIVQNNLLDSKSLSSSNKSLASSTTSINKLNDNKVNIHKRKASIPTSVSVVKKDFERNTSTRLTNTSNPSRRLSLIPPKKGPAPIIKQNSTKPTISLDSHSKLKPSLSPSISIESSHSDLTSNQQKPSKMTSKPTLGTTRTISHSIDLSSSDKNLNLSRRSLDTFDHQLMIQKVLIQSLEGTNEHLKKQYQHLLNRFDVMCILSEYYINENEQIKQQYELKLSKPQKANKHLKALIEQLKISHKNELITVDEQYRNQIDMIKELHKQQSVEYQQQIDKLLNEKIQLEIRCTSLQEQVDRFMEEMANSEHADPLLRRVEILEKDNTSLQTVLEIKNQELTQLRTKMNEQVFQREDQMVLQKRIDMAENRNQDLVCLLRNWQLNEKAVVVERDQLKEQIAQLERDNCQLTFENETLLYRIRQRPLSMSLTSKSILSSRSTTKIRDRANSFSSLITNSHEIQALPRALSLNYI